MVTEADLEWWLEKAPTLEWIFAKTYADTAPHSYVVHPRTEGMTEADYERAGRVIRRFGKPGKFHGWVNIYLADEKSGKKWWIMPEEGHDIAYNSTLINMANIQDVYGPQDVPDTAPRRKYETSGFPFTYDSQAVNYDLDWAREGDLGEHEYVRMLAFQPFKHTAPTVLDLGCGTGLVLDLRITHPTLYTGIDPSQGMLNELVAKHPDVKTIIAAPAEDVDIASLGKFDLVISTYASPSYMQPSTIRAGFDVATTLWLVMTYADGWVPDYYPAGTVISTAEAAEEECRRIIEENNGSVERLGNFNLFRVRK